MKKLKPIKISAKNQITLPSELRKELDLKKGDFINIITEGGIAYMKKTYKGCSLCEGKGKVESQNCIVCNGKGSLQEDCKDIMKNLLLSDVEVSISNDKKGKKVEIKDSKGRYSEVVLKEYSSYYTKFLNSRDEIIYGDKEEEFYQESESEVEYTDL